MGWNAGPVTVGPESENPSLRAWELKLNLVRQNLLRDRGHRTCCGQPVAGRPWGCSPRITPRRRDPPQRAHRLECELRHADRTRNSFCQSGVIQTVRGDLDSSGVTLSRSSDRCSFGGVPPSGPCACGRERPKRPDDQRAARNFGGKQTSGGSPPPGGNPTHRKARCRQGFGHATIRLKSGIRRESTRQFHSGGTESGSSEQGWRRSIPSPGSCRTGKERLVPIRLAEPAQWETSAGGKPQVHVAPRQSFGTATKKPRG